MLPAIEAGAASQGRTLENVNIAVNAFAITNDTERAFARQTDLLLRFDAFLPQRDALARLGRYR